MGKKANDSDSSQKNKTQESEPPTVTQNSEASTTKFDSSKAPSTRNSSLNMPTIVTVTLTIGFLVSIAASYGVQHYRDKYVIPPQKEKSFPFQAKISFDERSFRNVQGGDPALKFSQTNNPDEPPIVFDIVKWDRYIPLSEIEVYEYGVADVYNGGKFTFTHNYLTSTINYIIHENASVSAVFEQAGRTPNGSANDLIMAVSQGKRNVILVPLIPDTKHYRSFPNYSEDFTPYITFEEIDAQIESNKKKWEGTFEKMFSSAGQQQLPKAYLDLVESAYSYAINSFNQNHTIQLIGFHENFTRTENFFYLQSNNIALVTLDEQIFPLITLSKLESKDTLKVINSWMNLVNELGYMGSRITKEGIFLDKIQCPLLFQLMKELLGNTLFHDVFQGFLENLEYIAEHTWKSSIGEGGLEDVKWLGNSRGVFQLEPTTPKGSSSFELLCLLGDMSRVMQKVYEKVGTGNSTKWSQRFTDVETAMSKYWNDEMKQYGDLEEGKFKQSPSAHVPLILNLLKENSGNLEQFLQNLQQDPNFTPVGLQLSEEQGVSVATNYLLLQSLKHYSTLSGPSQELSHNMYSVLKNHLASVIARANRQERSFYGRYDKNMRPLGSKGNLDGTLVFPIMCSP